MPGPLSHIRVLDLSRILAGPWAGQVLADLGADVIKVERPGAGDDSRAWGPPFLKDEEGRDTRESGYFLSVNRGKRSIAIDLAKPEGQAVVRELARRSDILLENYKVGNLARFGLAYDDLKEIAPQLVYCSVTGFGQDGPRAQDAAYDFAIQAMGGLMSVTGERDDLPGGGPQKVGVPIIDLTTGLYTAIAALAGLARRNATGRGDHADIAMLDVATALLANQGMNHLLTGNTPKRSGNKHPNIQPQDVFACADGKIALGVGNDAQYQRLCHVIGIPEYATDPRFADNPSRLKNLPELLEAVRGAMSRMPVKQVVEGLTKAGVPCGPINTVPEVLADPQVQHRQMVRHLPHPASGTVPQIVSPLRFREAPLSFDRPPPMLGQHTDDVLRELGLDDAPAQNA
ncbi:CaiB/BaiF CoA transferase family protein [Roseomonas marmotae]|uniref:CoA transferase n=1 Tax=Roseomonas marmotae TaxID=2768161 RepID=A0ABS3KFA9_9PROT|nr:CaiB/BaiF CoA-transferase family protein [Roseomonas marmotae]MBO1076156.1 CoA transferase [Roseomonas marmotae]QTI81807.1 CoA transferase [Roseomonas marmotae]